jgi:hypothetical protein
MKVEKLDQLPPEYGCKLCGLTKPLAEMIVVHVRREQSYRLRPRCKACHNERERGHRREWKREYLKRWRRGNARLNRSYWDNEQARENNRIRAGERFREKHDAILIQGRLRRHGIAVSFKEAEALLAKFGRCYPTRYGLTQEGLRECERIRSAMRRIGRRISPIEIRIMVYEDGLYIKPNRQPRPYQRSAEKLRQWHRGQKSGQERRAPC